MIMEELYRTISNGSDINISIDTRTISSGDIYIGLKGDQFDGNSYVQEALDKGARLAIIDNEAYKIDDRCILVENTYQTLSALAKIHRQTFMIPILVIGGSNGKTTTKELISAVLSSTHTVHTTKGNLNNEIGVPLTILAMKPGINIAVIEIGANHADEHTRLMNIVCPTHVVVTNNGKDHLEGFGSIEGVRKANKEIYDCCRTIGGAAFVNKYIEDLVVDSADMNRTLYPLQSYESTSTLLASLTYNHTDIASQLFGSFNENNILAAIAIGEYFNVPLEKISSAIAEYQPTLKRSQIIEKNDHTIVLDCYNANPTSMELSLKDFFKSSEANKRVIIIGDMREVGETELDAHKEILQLISSHIAPSDEVIAVGQLFSTYQNDFPYTFFPTSTDAKEYFNSLDIRGKKVFLKASRGTKLETILE